MSFDDRDGVIWFDGELVPWREARTHVLTHTLHYGMGVFEGVRAYHTPDRGTCIFRLQEHTDRLFRSAHILRMEMPFDRATLNDAQRQEAEASRDAYQVALTKAGRGEITTEITGAGPFYFAEGYHQGYLAKNPEGYCGIGGTGVVCPIGVGVEA